MARDIIIRAVLIVKHCAKYLLILVNFQAAPLPLQTKFTLYNHKIATPCIRKARNDEVGYKRFRLPERKHIRHCEPKAWQSPKDSGTAT